jgi:hypothetical protein
LAPNVYIIGGGLPVDLVEVMPLRCITCIFNIVFYIKLIIVEKMRSAHRYHIIRKQTRRDTPLMLGGCADIYRHIPAYTRERAAAMFLGSIVREFYYKQYGENRTMIIKTAPFGI